MNAFEVRTGPTGKNSSHHSINKQSEQIQESQNEPNAAIGGPIEGQTYQEEQIQKAIEWFAMYLSSERDSYYGEGKPLSNHRNTALQGYFDAPLLDQVRVLQLVDRRVDNPWFYPHSARTGASAPARYYPQDGGDVFDVVVSTNKSTVAISFTDWCMRRRCKNPWHT